MVVADPSNAQASHPKRGRVAQFTNEQMAGKLMAMGVLPGSRIELVRRAPFGGGWLVRVDNLLLALRKEEIDSIVLK